MLSRPRIHWIHVARITNLYCVIFPKSSKPRDPTRRSITLCFTSCFGQLPEHVFTSDRMSTLSIMSEPTKRYRHEIFLSTTPPIRLFFIDVSDNDAVESFCAALADVQALDDAFLLILTPREGSKRTTRELQALEQAIRDYFADSKCGIFVHPEPWSQRPVFTIGIGAGQKQCLLLDGNQYLRPGFVSIACKKQDRHYGYPL